MRNAIGNALLFYIVITVVGLLIVFLSVSLTYSKAFRVKNNIVNIIERDGYDEDQINALLKDIGYRVVKNPSTVCVDRRGDGNILARSSLGTYRYCVIEYTTSRGKFYGVTTYMYFDIPLIESYLEFPIYGETKVYFDVK
jgi:hypothetical protein